MWGSLALGWAGLVLLVGAIWMRRRGELRRVPASAARFIAALRESLSRCGPSVSLAGLVPGRFTGIIDVDGQETPVPLMPMFRHFELAPGDLPHIVQRLVQEIRSDGLDSTTDFEFGELAADILPQVRSVEWFEQHSAAFGDSRLVHRRLGADLLVCYVIDDSWSMVFVCEGHLRRWRRTEAELFGLARRNLADRTDLDTGRRIEKGQPVAVRSADGYAAARLLLLDPDHADDLLVALPARDVLWIGEPGDADIGDLMARSAEECEQSTRPVSPKVYRVDAGVLTEAGPA